jgi:hypothetical protein
MMCLSLPTLNSRAKSSKTKLKSSRLTFGRIQKYVSPVDGSTKPYPITIAIDIAHLRWLWAAPHTLPRLAELWALIPDDAHPFPTLLLLLMDAAVEFV